MFDITEIFRWFNLVAGSVIIVWLVARRIRNPDLYSVRGVREDIWLLAFYWDCFVVVGTVEQLFNTGTTFRPLFASMAILVTIRMLRRDLDWFSVRKKEDTES